MTYRKTFTPGMALQKARQFCAYQERSHRQVATKLYDWGLRKQEAEEVIASLIADQYLNEERFALQFAGGKFRMKQWGRVKIAEALKLQQVSPYNIRKALEGIDEGDYEKTAKKIATKKWSSIRGQGLTNLTRRAKTTAFMLRKGYESAIIRRILEPLARGESSG
jgi:regulatory protein